MMTSSPVTSSPGPVTPLPAPAAMAPSIPPIPLLPLFANFSRYFASQHQTCQIHSIQLITHLLKLEWATRILTDINRYINLINSILSKVGMSNWDIDRYEQIWTIWSERYEQQSIIVNYRFISIIDSWNFPQGRCQWTLINIKARTNEESRKCSGRVQSPAATNQRFFFHFFKTIQPRIDQTNY